MLNLNTHSHAFTLIELLVVVLITAVLAAIALPQYQKSIMRSRLVKSHVLAKQALDRTKFFALENSRMPNLAEFTRILGISELTCKTKDCKEQEPGQVSGTCTCTAGDYAILYKATGNSTKYMMYAIYAPKGVSKQKNSIGTGFWVDTANGFHPVLTCVSDKKSTLATNICKKNNASRFVTSDNLEWYPF